MPFILEPDEVKTEDAIFWIDDSGVTTPLPSDPALTATLGHRLIHALLRLLFCPAFTVGATTSSALPSDVTATGPSTKEAVEPHLLWNGGLGSLHVCVPPCPPRLLRNRLDCLLCLLTCVCKPLYLAPADLPVASNRFMEALTSTSCALAHTLFFSLLNTVLAYDPGRWRLPLSNLLSDATCDVLVPTALQVLIVLLDYPPTQLTTSSAAAAPATLVGAPSIILPSQNVYRQLLASLTEPSDLELLFDRLLRVLSTCCPSTSMLSSAYQPVPFVEELLLFFWHLLDVNLAFLPHIVSRADVCRVVPPLACILYSSRQHTGHLNLMHVATFLLLVLSGHQRFADALNAPLQITLPFGPTVNGTHADLLVHVVHDVISSGVDQLNVLYSALLTVLLNISPYAQLLSAASAKRLLALLALFGSAEYVLGGPNNHQYIFYLVDALTALLNTQPSSPASNPHVLCAVIAHATCITSLAALARRPLPTPEPELLHAPPAVVQVPPSPCPATTSALKTRESECTRQSAASQLSHHPHSQHPQQTSQLTPPAASPPTLLLDQSPAPDSSARIDAHDAPLDASRRPMPVAHVQMRPPPPQSLSAEQVPGALPAVPCTSHATDSVQSWASLLRLDTLLAVIFTIAPTLDHHCRTSYQRPLIDALTTHYSQLVDLVRSTRFQAQMPPPTPGAVRHYQTNQFARLWFTTYLWGLIYFRNQSPPLFDATSIRLFFFAPT